MARSFAGYETGIRSIGLQPLITTFAMNDGTSRISGDLGYYGFRHRTTPWKEIANVASFTSKGHESHTVCARHTDGTASCFRNGSDYNGNADLGDVSTTPWIKPILVLWAEAGF